MVRLVGMINDLQNPRSTKFQFLYGAIGGLNSVFNFLIFFFVSIPIWCDWWPSSCIGIFGANMFQFLYGAIGGTQPDLELAELPRFNSYMVRLVDVYDQSVTVHSDGFQFLYGAIGGVYSR